MKVQHLALKITAIAAFLVLTLGIFLMLLRMAGVQMPFGDAYKINAQLPDGLQLVTNADVRSAGVKVGRLSAITSRGARAEVELQLDDDVVPVYRDARVLVRTKTLVGENYVELDRGHPRAGALPSGATLPIARAGDAVQLDQVLSTLDPRTRRHVQRTVRTMGGGFDGRGDDINAILSAMQPTVRDGGRLLAVLAEQRRQLGGLIADAGTVMQAVGERRTALQTLVLKLRTTADAVAARDDAFRASFAEVPPTLRQAAGSTERLGRLAGTATPVVADLTRAATLLTPAVRELGPAARTTRATVAELRRLLPESEPLVRNLETFADAAGEVPAPLDAALREGRPTLSYLVPFRRDIGSFFANVGSVVDTHDQYGQLGRVHPLVSPTSAAIWSPELRKALDALTDIGAVGALFREDTNAYPRPGSIGAPRPFDGKVDVVDPDVRGRATPPDGSR